jgi:hypothetical protein
MFRKRKSRGIITVSEGAEASVMGQKPTSQRRVGDVRFVPTADILGPPQANATNSFRTEVSGIPGQPKDCIDNNFGRMLDELPDDIEVDP